FCFDKNIIENDNYITGTALYRINNDSNKFREIVFKGFSKNPNSLVTSFEKNSIVLMVTIVQSVPVSYSDDEYTLTPEDLPKSSSLLLFSASVIPNSYISDNNG
ncbi:25833_t:CDS:2, partial [Racocetra persica]